MDTRLEVGERLGPYLIVREIARGGQGAVFEGRNPQSGVRVALKVLTDPSPVQRGRFLQEAQVLARLQHPNLPQVFEVEAQGHAPWFALELIQGRDLGDWVLQAGLPEPGAIVEVLAPIARALHYCHGQGLVHRDLKPRNILSETRTARPVLADFGLVQRDATRMGLDDVDALGRLSLTHEVKGTPSYMAPEQADAESFGGTGPWTDVYALGATLFFLLTGSPPQEGQSTVNVMVQLLKRTEAPDPLAKNPAADAALSEVCRRCLQTQPSERYPSALAVAEALEACRAAPPRSRLGLLIAASCLLLLILVGAAWGLAPAPPAAAEATLLLRVDADRVEVLRGGERLGEASPKAPLRLALTPGQQRLTLRRDGASQELALELTPGESEESVQLWQVVALDPGTSAKGGVFPAGRDAPARDAEGRSLQALDLPARVRLPLGRYRVSLRAPERHPREVEFEVSPRASLPDMKLRGEIRWRKSIPGSLWSCKAKGDLDGDGDPDLVLHASSKSAGERILALSGRDGRELWPNPVPINLWAGSYVQEEPEPAVIAIHGKRPTSLLWLDPASGRELRPAFGQGKGRSLTFYGITSFEGGRRGVVISSHYYDEEVPGRELIHLGPQGEERGRIDLAGLGARPGKNLRASWPATFDARGSGRARAVLWRFHRTFYLVQFGEPSQVLASYPPPRQSAAIRNHRNWWAVGDAILPVRRDERAAILSWVGQDPGQGIRTHLSLLASGPERRWTLELPGLYTWGRWLELRGETVFAAAFLLRNTLAQGRLVLIDPERGEVLRQVDVPEGLIGRPYLLRSRGERESIVVGTYEPSLVRLYDARTLTPRWSRSFRNRPKFRGKRDISYEMGRVVSDLDRDGIDELIVVRSWDGEVVVVDPLF